MLNLGQNLAVCFVVLLSVVLGQELDVQDLGEAAGEAVGRRGKASTIRRGGAPGLLTTAGSFQMAAFQGNYEEVGEASYSSGSGAGLFPPELYTSAAAAYTSGSAPSSNPKDYLPFSNSASLSEEETRADALPNTADGMTRQSWTGCKTFSKKHVTKQEIKSVESSSKCIVCDENTSRKYFVMQRGLWRTGGCASAPDIPTTKCTNLGVESDEWFPGAQNVMCTKLGVVLGTPFVPLGKVAKEAWKLAKKTTTKKEDKKLLSDKRWENMFVGPTTATNWTEDGVKPTPQGPKARAIAEKMLQRATGSGVSRYFQAVARCEMVKHTACLGANCAVRKSIK